MLKPAFFTCHNKHIHFEYDICVQNMFSLFDFTFSKDDRLLHNRLVAKVGMLQVLVYIMLHYKTLEDV